MHHRSSASLGPSSRPMPPPALGKYRLLALKMTSVLWQGSALHLFLRSRHSAGVVSAIMGLRSRIGLIKGPQHSREVCYLFRGERWIQSQIRFNAEPRKEHRYQVAYRCGQARTLDFTHAATESNIAQPPFSRQIRQLEEEVGCQAARKVQRRLTVDVARNSSINARAAIRSLVSKPSSNRW